MTETERSCPICGNIVSYSNIYKKRRADEWNSVCHECRGKRRKENRDKKGLKTISISKFDDEKEVLRRCTRICSMCGDVRVCTKPVKDTESPILCKRCSCSRMGSDPTSIEKRKLWLKEHPDIVSKIVESTHTEKASQKRIKSCKMSTTNPEVRQRLSKISQDAWKDPNSKLNSPEYRKFHRELTLRAMKASRSSVSSIELRLGKLIESMGFEHNRQYILGYIPDFVNKEKKVIVEMFGDYYHARSSHPTYSQIDWINPTTKKSGVESRQRDQTRFEEFKCGGYHVFVVWETDLRRSESKVIEQIQSFLDEIEDFLIKGVVLKSESRLL